MATLCEQRKSRGAGLRVPRRDGEERGGEERGPPCRSRPHQSDGGWALSLEPGSRASSATYCHNRLPRPSPVSGTWFERTDACS